MLCRRARSLFVAAPGSGRETRAIRRAVLARRERRDQGVEQVGRERDPAASAAFLDCAADAPARIGLVEVAAAQPLAATAYGRAIHKAYNYGPGFEKEFTLANGRRADAVNLATREVVELKPNNPAAIAQGRASGRGLRGAAHQGVPGHPVYMARGDLQPAMSERDAVQRAFDQFGKEAGFEKKSGSWYGRSDEVVSISNLQKSQYGPQYYFNQAFWLRQLGDERFPKENQSHIRARLGSLLPPEDAEKLKQLLDLEYELPDEQRVNELVTQLRERLLPLIERGSSVAGLHSMLDDGTFAHAGIRGPAQEVLAAVKR